MQNYLGIDWGSAKIGIALGHAETGVALAYSTLKNDESLFLSLQHIVELENISTVVIGIPSHVNREETEYEGEKFGKRLADLIPGILVFYQDEMFTTRMAQANLLERGEKNVGKHDDAEAARIILQEWMDKQR